MSDLLSVPFGVCSVQFHPLTCEGFPDTTIDDVVSCGLAQVAWTRVLTDAISISVPGGYPGKQCFEFEQNGVTKRYDVTITTCGINNPKLDAMLGYSDLMINDLNNIVGSKANAISDPSCICACGDDACARRVGMTVWSLNLCPGSSKNAHPDGQYMATTFSGIEWQDTTDTFTLDANVQGQTYTGYSYENPNFGQGPSGIIPALDAAEGRAWYRTATDVCPPGGCECGACGSDLPTPLALV